MFDKPLLPPVRHWTTPVAPTQMCSTLQSAKSQPPILAAVPATGVGFEEFIAESCAELIKCAIVRIIASRIKPIK
jgi:hypothetical protein